MAVYPLHTNLQAVAPRMDRGNFGLWYNKFVPIADFNSCKASNEKGEKDYAAEHYLNRYSTITRDPAVGKLLDARHRDQENFCKTLSNGYEAVVIRARLKSPLITGIGESHPHEVGMVFDHNIGIPYIPASGVKGIVRFAHTLSLIDKIPDGEIKNRDKENKPCPPYFDDEAGWTNVLELFGTQKQRGSVVFLDAFPEKTPALHLDIMNPHYGKYYGDDKHQTPPADYLEPTPIKFLTVAQGTVFVFRALVDKTIASLAEAVRSAFQNALTNEGVGAKTAVGYGMFEIIQTAGQTVGGLQPAPEAKPVDKFITAVKILKPTDAGPIGSKIDEALKKLESDDDKKTFALAVKEHLGSGFKKSKARDKLKSFLGE